ncbi:uncharacterized protein TEOVI_000612500 [Trypanosoma equiperdum]|uniref:Ribosome associated membrane protein RAMP4 n=1 Tax=Trypanosoma equiperdum TaxID=5694 RepID=A0A1G4I7D9_TRYEQ|nr:hypothetical protein, conserved [Trypanosoma equiperdum]
MPLSPTRMIRVKAQKQNSQISMPRLSDEEKKKLREKRENASALPSWLGATILFIVLGSTVVQIYFTITSHRGGVVE